MVKAVEKSHAAQKMINGQVADMLDEAADLLARQGANEFRVRAYRRAAQTVRTMKPQIQEIFAEQGRRGLMKLQGIGESLARSIDQALVKGQMPMLMRLRNNSVPERVFTTVADVGPKLAERIHRELGIETLAELEAASWDGRLARVPGMGQKRIRAVRETLSGRFGRPVASGRREAMSAGRDEPTVGELLDVDEQYRRLADRDQLLRIAPRRFNPGGAAWLPILHTERNGRRYTAMFSNTARAHELDATHDWVVIYRDEQRHGAQWTVVTSRLGRLKGRRVVRGREHECAAWYAVH